MFGEISLRSSTGVESGSDEALPGFFLGSFIGMTYGAGEGGGGRMKMLSLPRCGPFQA